MMALSRKNRRCLFYFITNFFIFIFCYIGAGPVGGGVPIPEAEVPPQVPQPVEEERGDASVSLLLSPLPEPLSSSQEALVLKEPVRVQLTVEYFVGEPYTAALTEKRDITALIKALQDAPRLPDDAAVVSATPSNTAAIRLEYKEGYGNLYLFSGYVNGGKKQVTVIQDSDNHMYQAKLNVSEEIFEKARPQIRDIDADKINIYTAIHYRRQSLQAQLTEKESFAPLVKMLNQLEQAGGVSKLDKPDYIISYVPTGSAEETDMWYVWVSGKKVTLVPAGNTSVAYVSSGISTKEFKKLVQEFSVK